MADKIFLALLETSAAHANRSREGFQRLNLTDGQPKILYNLAKGDGCIQKELAERCRIKPSTLTVMLARLEEQGYIYRESLLVSGGKHACRVLLTKKGWDIVKKITDLIDSLEERTLRGFTETEKRQLLDLLGRAADNLNRE